MEPDDSNSGKDLTDNLNTRSQRITQLQQEKDESCNVSLKKSPRKVIHFSDGTIEEYSSDEESDKPAQYNCEINPSAMQWGPWLWYQTLNVGTKSLEVCDYLGEHLASFFGITTPKYQYEIDEYNRMMAEEEEQRQKEDLEMGGWNDSGKLTETSTLPPEQSNKF
ncbi:Protein FAM177A1 [Blattella germanica]|nr:Protein FAM177A1 [Blattella germanica]